MATIKKNSYMSDVSETIIYVTHIYAYDNAGNSSSKSTGNINVSEQKTTDVPTLSISGHVQGIGWKSSVTNGQVSGTTGKSLREYYIA